VESLNRLPKESPISKLNRDDFEHFERLADFLGALGRLPDDLHMLYHKLHATLQPSLAVARRQDRVAGVLYTFCHKHLALATVMTLRMYMTPAARETRAAVECAGIARKICEDEHAFEVFRNGQAETKAANVFKQTFSSGNMFPQQDHLLRPLKKFYADASRFSHLNPTTLLQHLNPGVTADQMNVRFQDLRDKEVGWFVIWTCHAHIAILYLATRTFFAVGADLRKFAEELEAVSERLSRFGQLEKAKDVLLATSDPD
jgi:hypothetical protein